LSNPPESTDSLVAQMELFASRMGLSPSITDMLSLASGLRKRGGRSRSGIVGRLIAQLTTAPVLPALLSFIFLFFSTKIPRAPPYWAPAVKRARQASPLKRRGQTTEKLLSRLGALGDPRPSSKTSAAFGSSIRFPPVPIPAHESTVAFLPLCLLPISIVCLAISCRGWCFPFRRVHAFPNHRRSIEQRGQW